MLKILTLFFLSFFTFCDTVVDENFIMNEVFDDLDYSSFMLDARKKDKKYNFLYPSITLSSKISNFGASFIDIKKYKDGKTPSMPMYYDIEPNLKLTFSWDFDIIKLILASKENSYSSKIAKIKAVRTVNENFKKNIKTLYTLYLNKTKLDLAKKRLVDLNKNLDDALRFYKRGDRSKTEVLSVQIQIKNKQIQIQSAQMELQNQKTKFANTLNIDYPILKPNFDLVKEIQKKDNYDYELAYFDIKSSKEEIKKLKHSLYPSLTFSTSFSTSLNWQIPWDNQNRKYLDSVFDPKAQFNLSLDFLLDLSPLFFPDLKLDEIEHQKKILSLKRKKLEKKQKTENIADNISIKEINLLKNQLSQYQELADLLKQKYKLINQDYKNALVKFEDVKSAYNSYVDTSNKVLEKKIELTQRYLDFNSIEI